MGYRIYFLLAFIIILFHELTSAQEINIVPEDPNKDKIRIVFSGDVVGHKKLFDLGNSAQKKDNFYNAIFIDMKDVISSADLAFVNLETPVSKTELNKPKPFLFNSSPRLVKALSWVGFDLVSVANNHALDQGNIGLKETLSTIKKYSMTALGAHEKKEKSLEGNIIEVKDKKIGFLAFTELHNGGKDSSAKKNPIYLNLLSEKTLVLETIENLKNKVDFLVVSVHWGKEYEKKPNAFQVKMADLIHKAGADIIVGHHPHVLQPVQWRKLRNGTKKVTLFSLGNLASNQSRKEPGPERDSALIEIVIGDKLESANVYPLFTYNWDDTSGIKTVMIDKEIERLDNALSGLEKSPAKSFLYAEKQMLEQRRREIYKSLKIKLKFDKPRGLATEKKKK